MAENDVNRFKPDEEQVVMTVSHDENKKSVTLQFISATEINGGELLYYLEQFIEMNMDDPEEIFDDSEEVERIIN